jgi:hypothetical protein
MVRRTGGGKERRSKVARRSEAMPAPMIAIEGEYGGFMASWLVEIVDVVWDSDGAVEVDAIVL